MAKRIVFVSLFFSVTPIYLISKKKKKVFNFTRVPLTLREGLTFCAGSRLFSLEIRDLTGAYHINMGLFKYFTKN